MKILLVITGLGVGGAERLVTNLADRYVEIGHQVVLVNFGHSASILPNDPRVCTVHLGMTHRPDTAFRCLLKLRRIILRFQPDVINSHLIHANIATRLMRLVTPMTCLISSAHNTFEGSRSRMLAYRITDHLANISTNVSEEAVRAFIESRATKQGRMLAVHNGVDTLHFAFDPLGRHRVRNEFSFPNHETVLLAVGRLCEPKDYPNLFHAVGELKTLGHTPPVLIAGDGPLRRSLESLAKTLGIASQVRFLGIRSDIPALMSACDVLVLPSRREGFGLVVAEAMSCERFIVATDCGGVREVLGGLGLLPPPHDTKALAAALAVAVTKNHHDLARFGSTARQRIATNYSIDATARCYLAIYSANAGGGLAS